MDNKILSSLSGAVGTLTFNNPGRHNAMSLEMWRGAAAVLEDFAANPAVRVVVLTGAGGKAFVSGADISKFESERANAESAAIYNAAVEEFYQTLLDLPQPSAAIIRGYCIGGGLGLAACCDLRICNEFSRFGVPAAKLGLGYGFDNISRMAALIGPQFAAEMLFTARQFDASEAARIGLVNRVIPEVSIESYAEELTAAIAENAPLTLRAVKRILRELRQEPGNRDLAACSLLVKQCFDSEDYREGRRAFAEKRKPVFTGK